MAGRRWFPPELRAICRAAGRPVLHDRHDARRAARLAAQREHQPRRVWTLRRCPLGAHWHIGRTA